MSNYFLNKSGATVTIYSDAAGTTLADIQDMAGVAVPGSVLTVGADSRIPLFKGPDGVDTLYAKVQGTANLEPIYARFDDRLDTDTIIRCTSGTRPASPGDDQLIYETDTNKILRYDTSTSMWLTPKKKYDPDVTEITANSAAVSAETTLITSGVIAADGVTKFNVEGFWSGATASVATDIHQFRLYDGATLLAVCNRYANSTTAGSIDGGSVTKRGLLLSAGNHTLTLKVARLSGTGTITVLASATSPGVLEVREAA